MAPEIFEGQTSTIQTDVYSLGVLAYEVLTGVRPFLGDSYNSLMMAHLTGLPRDPRNYRQDMPKGLSRVVLRAMSRDPEKRFRSVEQFTHDFQVVAGIEDTSQEGKLQTVTCRQGFGLRQGRRRRQEKSAWRPVRTVPSQAVLRG